MHVMYTHIGMYFDEDKRMLCMKEKMKLTGQLSSLDNIVTYTSATTEVTEVEKETHNEW